MTDQNLCECCEKNEPIGVAAVPGVPVSVAYCRTCLEQGVWGPLWLAENTIEMVGGLEHAADWIKEARVIKDGEYLTVAAALS